VASAPAASVAGEESDDGVEDGDDAVDDGHDDSADAVDDCHDGPADGTDAVLDLSREGLVLLAGDGIWVDRSKTYARHDGAHFDGLLLLFGMCWFGGVLFCLVDLSL
jgi:hypothetical protein